MIRDAGKRVCVIEGGALGGECPNSACIPTKALLASATAYYNAKHHLAEFGVYASKVQFRFSDIMKHKDEVVHTITGGGKKVEIIAKKSGITLVKGFAKFVGVRSVLVNKKKMSANEAN